MINSATCIVAIKTQGGGVVVAGDRRGTDERYEYLTTDQAKVFSVGPVAMGGTGSFRGIDVARYIDPPRYIPNDDCDKWMITQFYPAIRKALTKAGYTKKDGEREEGSVYLAGFNSNIYLMQSDYSCVAIRRTFHAVGCGAPYALGYLHGALKYGTRLMDKYPWPTEEEARNQAEMAIEAAQTFSAGVSCPVDFETAPYKGIVPCNDESSSKESQESPQP